MMLALLRGAALWLGSMLALAAGAAHADTPVALYKSFAGNVNFTGTQVTMRDKDNKKPCAVASSATSLNATLGGIPSGATVLSAQLYWAGSGSQADYAVSFDGTQVGAPADRQYSSATIGGGYDYFSGAADVTAQVAAKGNGSYTFSGLTIDNGSLYCGVEGVLGGFSLLVVYSSAAEPFRVLNLYEGFQYFRYNGITLNLSNFQVPKTLPDTATARLGHITWEGDATLDQGGEQLLFNDTELSDRLNPAGNQFNSASSINGDAHSYGVDFDAYTIAPSAGLFQPGQAAATTRYQSGQDMVLLSAEVIAIPNVPAADLSITMTRGAALQVGVDAAYTITVRNAGPNTESGPVVVTDTMPSGMSFSSASGSGWTCAASGQKVSCSAPGPLAAGASLPPLTLLLAPGAAGDYTNSAMVSGQLFDNVAANNSASDTATATVLGAAAYAFTTSPCLAGAVLGSAGCQSFTGPVVAGSPVPVYVTALSAGSPAKATALSTTADTTLKLRFALGCVDPATTQGVSASFAGKALPPCVANGATPAAGSAAWSEEVPMTFITGRPSALVTPGFSYEDVGMVTLNLIDPANRTALAAFVSKPASLKFATVKRTLDGAANPAPDPVTGVQPGFVKAGQAFTLTVGALTSTGKWAPNFGNEKDARWWPQIKLQQVQERELPAVQGAFEGAANGLVTGTGFWWDEAGKLNLAPLLNDYLGAGSVGGVALDIGRFYPDHFTTVAVPAFACMKAMACPAGITGAAYSAQPFKAEVHAIGMTGKPLSNYVGATVTLSAAGSAGGIAMNPRGGAIADNTAVTGIGDPAAAPTPRYGLPAMYSSARPRALDWTAPAAIYLRAETIESVIDKTGKPQPVTISSHLPAGSVEGGLMVVNGRLQLANSFGSELLKLPVRMNAQFWTGAAWDNNAGDNASDVAYAGNLGFSDCLGALALGSGANNCDSALLAVAPAAPLRLKDGAGTFWLPAPGRGKAGSAWFLVNDGNPRWLPSTRARAVFGIYKSPLIYMREVH